MSSYKPESQQQLDNIRARRILIFGATGLIGTHITQSLLQAKADFEEICLFTSPDTVERKPSVISGLKHAGARVIIGDLQTAVDVEQAFHGIDTVISCVGRDAIEAQIPLIHLAAKSPSVNWFFPSEFGTDVVYGPESANEIPHQKKLKVRATISEHKQSLDYTYVVTGPYGDGDSGLYLSSSLGAEQAGSFDVKNKRAVLLGDGNLKLGLTPMKDVGKLVLAALQHPAQARNRALRLNSFHTTDAEILHEFERQTGGQRWDVTYTSLSQLRKFEKEAWSSGHALAVLFTLRRIWAEGGTIYATTDNGLIGVTSGLTTLAEAVHDAIQKQLTESQQVNRKLQ